jgi:cobalt-zinc-cadmium efflux system outer membrane protein
LLSQKYFIQESEAQVITARLWDNPNLHAELGAFNPYVKSSEAWFNPGSNGQQLFILSQLFLTAGKINKRVSLADINKTIAQYQFFDLMRTLRYTLRTTFSNLYFDLKSLQFYKEEIPIIERTVNLYETQYNKGNLSLKEVVRLKSLLFSLQNEKLVVSRRIQDSQETLNLLLQTKSTTVIKPLLDSILTEQLQISAIPLENMLDSARTYRYDLKGAEKQVQFAQVDYLYQRALAVPDPTIGITYDRGSNYIQNYTGINLDIPLPVLNRNQGNVQAAKIRITENSLQLQYLEKTFQEEVAQSYAKALETDNLYKNFDQKFTSDFDVLIDGVIRNFERRNISLIEFIDLYESYKATTLQKYGLQNDRLNAIEDLNFRTGREIFNW